MDCFATGGYILALILGRALNWLHSTPDQINDLLANELALTTVALKDHPKVYWLWNHRRWCLQNIPDGPLVDGQPSRKWMTASWDKELAVVENMLNGTVNTVQFLASIYLMSALRRSHRLGLQEICSGEHACAAARCCRAGVYNQ